MNVCVSDFKKMDTVRSETAETCMSKSMIPREIPRERPGERPRICEKILENVQEFPMGITRKPQ